MNKIYLILLVLILKTLIILSFNDSYLLNFILIFGFSFIITSNIYLSLSIALIHLFIITFINYNISLYTKNNDIDTNNNNKTKKLNLLIFICFIFSIKNMDWINKYSNIINFFGLTYITISILEWLIHKHIMHCNKNSLFYKILSFIDIFKYFNDTCTLHMQHHKEVKPDMNLTMVSNQKSLFMAWNITIMYIIALIIILILLRFITRIKLSNISIIIIACIISILWCYLWNKIHPTMHNYNGEYSIKKGVYENVLNLNILNDLLYRNHEYHHMQKGINKGNYNIIFIGADEWFGTNVKNINNTKYCSNADVKNEEICLQ